MFNPAFCEAVLITSSATKGSSYRCTVLITELTAVDVVRVRLGKFDSRISGMSVHQLQQVAATSQISSSHSSPMSLGRQAHEASSAGGSILDRPVDLRLTSMKFFKRAASWPSPPPPFSGFTYKLVEENLGNFAGKEAEETSNLPGTCAELSGNVRAL